MSDAKKSRCHGCGLEITFYDSKFCTQCGAWLALHNIGIHVRATDDEEAAQNTVCTECGEKILFPDANFCTECGAELAIQNLPVVQQIVKVKHYIKTGHCIQCAEEIAAHAVDTCTHCGVELPIQKSYSWLVDSQWFVRCIILLTWCKPLALLLAFAVVETSLPHSMDLEIINASVLFGGVFADWRWTKPLMSLFFLYYVYLLDLLVARRSLFIWHFMLATLLPTATTFWWAKESYSSHYNSFAHVYLFMLLIQALVCVLFYKSNLVKMTFWQFDRDRLEFWKSNLDQLKFWR